MLAGAHGRSAHFLVSSFPRREPGQRGLQTILHNLFRYFPSLSIPALKNTDREAQNCQFSPLVALQKTQLFQFPIFPFVVIQISIRRLNLP